MLRFLERLGVEVGNLMSASSAGLEFLPFFGHVSHGLVIAVRFPAFELLQLGWNLQSSSLRSNTSVGLEFTIFFTAF